MREIIKKIRNRWNELPEGRKLKILKQTIAACLLGCIVMVVLSFPIRIIVPFPLPEGWDQSTPSIISAEIAIVFIILGIILLLIVFYCNYLTKSILKSIENIESLIEDIKNIENKENKENIEKVNNSE